MTRLNAIQRNTLAAFLDDPARPEGTMSLHELRGFLWGLASAPVTSDPDEWLSFVFAGDDPCFRDSREEDIVIPLLLDSLDEQYDRIEQEDSLLDAPEYAWHPGAEQRWPLTDWCTGLLKAHFWLQDEWDALLAQTEPVQTDDGTFDIVEEIDNTLDMAALFADVDAALGEATDSGELLAALPELASQLPWLVQNYAECGGLLAEMQEALEQQPFRREQEKIGRNDPCFCGSGKKYKHCCLNAANDD